MDRSARMSSLVLVALASGFVIASVDATVVNVAAVAIGRSLQSSVTGITWLVDSYVLTFASLLLLGGALATEHGSRQLYLAGMVVFLAASIGCALAPDELILIATRALEGAGAALFMPSSLSLLVGIFTEPAQQARMLGLWSAIVAVSAAIGPSLGGIMVSAFGWRSIFLINIPVVAVGIAMTLRVIPPTTGTRRRVSPVGHALFFVAVAAGAFILIQGRSSGFSAPETLAAGALLVAAASVLITHQMRTSDPIMPWTLFTRRCFRGVNTVGLLYSGALYGCLYLMGLYFQNVRHVSAIEAGLQMLPMTMCFPLGNLLYTQIHHRVSNATIMATCLGTAGLASALLLLVSPGTPYWHLAVILGLANSGAGLVTASMTAASVRAAGGENASHAGAVLNTGRQVGTLIGIAIVSLILQSFSNGYEGLHLASGLIAVVYLLAGLTAAATARPPKRCTVRAADVGPVNRSAIVDAAGPGILSCSRSGESSDEQ